MTARAGVSLVAAMAHLAVAFIVLLRRTKSPLVLPLILLCLDLFAWNLAALAWEASGRTAFHDIDVALSPLTAAFGFHVIVAFVGRVRELRWALVANYLLFAALVIPFPQRQIELLIPIAVAPMALVSLVLLRRHLHANVDAEERTRTWAVVVAFVLAAVAGPLEYFNPRVPIGGLAFVGTTGLVALVTVRFRLLGTRPTHAGVPLLLAAGATLSCVLAYRRSGGSTLVLAVASGIVVVTLFFALRAIVFGDADERARAGQLALLGRLSAQLAHDLKNPLATIKGALQFLEVEREAKRPLAEYTEYLAIMLAQVERLHRVIEDYQRLGRVEAVPTPIDLNQLVQRVVALQPFAAHGVEIELDLAGDLPKCSVDPDLMAAALENLMQNSFEALSAAGRVTVATRATGRGVSVSVTDTGPGMDPRQRANAFDEFFTTKSTGSGLGLAFVRRVAEAHGGGVSIDSTLGRGTAVTIELAVQ